jgi:cytochrome c oxidase assembly protein subunit 15
MTPQVPNRWLHRYAVLTAAVALLPIGMGALVTTLGAGMAFLDWPTSDGQNMFLYPWLSDFRAHPDKFVEHGHRLAGSLIGLFSIGLVVWTLRVESRTWVRRLAIGILGAVIGQGLLGGFRVIADAQVAALVHGVCASLIFSTIGLFALVTSRRWAEVGGGSQDKTAEISTGLVRLAVLTPLAMLAQSVVGGFIRHFGSALHEHLGGAIFVTGLCVATVVACWRTKQSWLRSAAIGLLAVLLVQLSLGAGAWVTRFGFPPAGYVAVQQAPEQIVIRSLHTVVAMFALLASVQLAARVLRLRNVGLTSPTRERGRTVSVAVNSERLGAHALADASGYLAGGAVR